MEKMKIVSPDTMKFVIDEVGGAAGGMPGCVKGLDKRAAAGETELVAVVYGCIINGCTLKIGRWDKNFGSQGLLKHGAPGDVIRLSVRFKGLGDAAPFFICKCLIRGDILSRIKEHHFFSANQPIAAGCLSGPSELIQFVVGSGGDADRGQVDFPRP